MYATIDDNAWVYECTVNTVLMCEVSPLYAQLMKGMLMPSYWKEYSGKNVCWWCTWYDDVH